MALLGSLVPWTLVHEKEAKMVAKRGKSQNLDPGHPGVGISRVLIRTRFLTVLPIDAAEA